MLLVQQAWVVEDVVVEAWLVALVLHVGIHVLLVPWVVEDVVVEAWLVALVRVVEDVVVEARLVHMTLVHVGVIVVPWVFWHLAPL